MPILSSPAFGPRTALAYVTGGTLLCVWTLVWYCTRDFEMSRTQWFWVAGFFLSGVTFLFLGLTLGPLGRAARQAEMPPPEAVRAEAAIRQTAAGQLPLMAPVAPVAGTPPQPVAPAAAPVVPAGPVQVSPAR
ncbi:hypothetical protein [Frigoriglobus tundricola]|uniref:Uncharacterized protein n=1 Tax=Frigoriglobus tundricola TaxID=2774151 RepID=A0A6M5Z0J9_9BACT|nr:hypothetical protein [Frigoriglobus tundricola]QJW99678.1 hypothetical protein FTUN_7297 [Frigoriglobus tundricola]